MFDKSVEISQEIVSLSISRNIPESELWRMPIDEYYHKMASYQKYVRDENERIKMQGNKN